MNLEEQYTGHANDWTQAGLAPKNSDLERTLNEKGYFKTNK